jgi:hypothetical protein
MLFFTCISRRLAFELLQMVKQGVLFNAENQLLKDESIAT